MRKTVTIRLPQELSEELEAVSSEEGSSRSEVVRDALRRQFALREFRRLRQSLLPEAEARGILSDDDVFDRVS
jgi:metal-responsive CopG/Arc/MetJ family transcriptional regulator